MKKNPRFGAPVIAALIACGLPNLAWADRTASQFTQPFQIADSSSVQQQRSQPIPVTPPEQQHWAISVGGIYTHRKGETDGWAPNLEVDYSATNRLMLHVMVPFAYDHLSGGSAHYGLGDAEVGLRYRFIDDDPQGWRPAVAAYPLVDFPTGNRNENLGTGRTHVFLPLWLSKTLGSWIPYGGGGYWINPGPSNRNWVLAAAGLIKVISQQLSLTGEVFYASSSKVGIKEQTGFDVGARYNITANHHVEFTIGRGIENASVTNQLTAYVNYIFTF